MARAMPARAAPSRCSRATPPPGLAQATIPSKFPTYSFEKHIVDFGKKMITFFLFYKNCSFCAERPEIVRGFVTEIFKFFQNIMCLFRIPSFGYETTVVTILELMRGNTRCRNFSITSCKKNIWAGSATKKMYWIYNYDSLNLCLL